MITVIGVKNCSVCNALKLKIDLLKSINENNNNKNEVKYVDINDVNFSKFFKDDIGLSLPIIFKEENNIRDFLNIDEFIYILDKMFINK